MLLIQPRSINGSDWWLRRGAKESSRLRFRAYRDYGEFIEFIGFLGIIGFRV